METTYDLLEEQKQLCVKALLEARTFMGKDSNNWLTDYEMDKLAQFILDAEHPKSESNRLDGVVMQKPASIERLKELIEKKIKEMEYTFHQEVGVVITTNAIQESLKVIDEELPAMLLAENGEGYSDGIGQTLEATKRTEKMLLDECCKALGWQGGTIHQIKNILSAARRVKLVHDEVELSNDWDKLKAAIVTLKAVV